MRSFFLFGLLICTPAVSAEEHKYLKAFPAASEGMTRFVLELPHKERDEEGAYRVELTVGKTIETDGVNKYFIGGTIEAQPLKGWGFTYYEVKKLGPVGSTRIGVPPGTPTVTKFVSGPKQMIAYNSRVPIVIYVPKGAEVQYRIFKAGETKSIKEG
ncbi:MAG: ecotin family protein [Planctomycetaceae bacterium]|nr:ecotin family protein [Planctomycetaceae bacterium]